MSLLIKRHNLSTFYRFEQTDRPRIWRRALNSGYDVVRRVDVVYPTVPTELNAAVPVCYFIPRALEPNELNDYGALDRVLSGVGETVVVAITVQPTSIEQEQRRFAGYMERVYAINRPRNDALEPLRGVDFLGASGASPRCIRASADQACISNRGFRLGEDHAPHGYLDPSVYAPHPVPGD
ncbi:MAG: hypothetical protein KAY37_11635 [Phycisphaerae bacterium]|nr:hypothetical protein [Phycisphaerae bacterium]